MYSASAPEILPLNVPTEEALCLIREKCHRLREKYAAAVDAYNELADEAKDRSDSSSSSSDDDDDDCCIM